MKDKIDYCKMLFGSSLFADHLKQDEEDTLWENKTFTNLKKYLEDNHSPAYAAARGTSQEVLDAELKKSLDTLWDCADCAKLYRNKLIPSTGEWMYRGMGLPLDLFKKMANKFPDSKKKDGIVIASVPYQYKRQQILSHQCDSHGGLETMQHGDHTAVIESPRNGKKLQTRWQQEKRLLRTYPWYG